MIFLRANRFAQKSFFPHPIWPIEKEGKGCETDDITVLLCTISSFHRHVAAG